MNSEPSKKYFCKLVLLVIRNSLKNCLLQAVLVRNKLFEHLYQSEVFFFEKKIAAICGKRGPVCIQQRGIRIVTVDEKELRKPVFSLRF